jgi:peptidoglycan/LPS O-acetylase OafA/YrhL
VAKERFDHLDSLRGLAALTVVLSHFWGAYDNRWPEYLVNSPAHILYDGFAAVSLFFVLSGFVLSYRPISRDEPVVLGKFFVARFFRIYLPFLAVLVVTWLLERMFQSSIPVNADATTWIRDLSQGHIGLAELTRQALFMEPHTGEMYLLPQGWTLKVELEFSALVPFLVVIGMRSRVWLILLSAFLYFVFHFPVYLIHFALGVLLSTTYQTFRGQWSRWHRVTKVAFLGVSLGLYGSRFIGGIRWDAYPDAVWLLTGLGAAGILLATLASANLRGPLVSPPLLVLGRVSYSLYLNHFVVLVLLVPWLFHGLGEVGVTPLFLAPTALGLYLVAVVAVSLVTQVVFEKSSVVLGKLLIAAWSRSRARP